jgi:hypothetical protein
MVLPNLGRSVMSDLLFSRAQIEGLVQKLGSPEVGLSGPEMLLLLAIFEAAGNKVRSVSAGPADVIVTDLHRRLLEAFIPDAGDEYTIRPDNIEG